MRRLLLALVAGAFLAPALVLAGPGAGIAWANCPGSLCGPQGVAVIAAYESGAAVTGSSATAGAATVSLSKSAAATSGVTIAGLAAGQAVDEAVMGLTGLDPYQISMGQLPWWWPETAGAGDTVTSCVTNSALKVSFPSGLTPNHSDNIKTFGWRADGTQSINHSVSPHPSYLTNPPYEFVIPMPSGGCDLLTRVRIEHHHWAGLDRLLYDGPVDVPMDSGPMSGKYKLVGVCTFIDGSVQPVTVEGNALDGTETVTVMPGYTCPPGSVHTASTLTWEGADGTSVPVHHQDAPAWVQNLNPACYDGSCRLILRRGMSADSPACIGNNVWNSACTGWASDPDRAAKYSCWYGPDLVNLEQCGAYALFPDGDIRPSELGTPEEEAQAANPTDCSTTWNPLTWITAIICVAKDLLVPSPGFLEAQFGQLSLDFCANGAGSLMCATNEMLAPFGEFGQPGGPGGDNGCLGVEVQIPNPMGEAAVFHPLQNCGEALGQISGFWLTFSTAVVYLSAVVVAGRMLAKTIGAEQAAI